MQKNTVISEMKFHTISNILYHTLQWTKLYFQSPLCSPFSDKEAARSHLYPKALLPMPQLRRRGQWVTLRVNGTLWKGLLARALPTNPPPPMKLPPPPAVLIELVRV